MENNKAVVCRVLPVFPLISSFASDVGTVRWPSTDEEENKLWSRILTFLCCVEGEENADDTVTSVSTSEDGEHEPLSEEKDILENLRPVSPKPGHIERVKAPTSPQSRRHDPREARFLKINVRHITDGQVILYNLFNYIILLSLIFHALI